MVAAGTDIFRLNCSHRRGGDFERVYPLIRKAAQDLGRKAVLGCTEAFERMSRKLCDVIAYRPYNISEQ